VDPHKRDRLESAGWKIGSTKDFLRLSDEEATLIELKLALAAAVRAQRKRRSLTQEDLARLLGSSQSRVAKIEAADPSVSIDLMIRSLFKMGARRKEVASYIVGSGPRRAA